MGKRAAETFYRVFLSSYTAHQSYSAQIRQLHTAVSDQTRTVSMAENSPSVSGTCLGAPSFPRRKARSCTLESISTERLLTVQHATVQQIRLAAYLHTWQDLNLTTTFISMSLFLAYPTSCLKTFSPGSTSRDTLLFPSPLWIHLLLYTSPGRWPMTTAFSRGSKAQVARAVSAMPPPQRKIQGGLTALCTSTQALNSCGLPSVLCSTSSCKFIFSAPLCQCHSVLTDTGQPSLPPSLQPVLLQSRYTTIPTIWASGKCLTCITQEVTQLPTGLLRLGEAWSAHPLNLPHCSYITQSSEHISALLNHCL